MFGGGARVGGSFGQKNTRTNGKKNLWLRSFLRRKGLLLSFTETTKKFNERKRLLQQHSAIIARRNWEITQRNAWPRMGGVAPRAPPVE